MIRDLVYERTEKFFEKRFGRKFNPDKDPYAMEWLERFQSGHPDTYMDGNSLEVYRQLLKEWV